MNELCCNQCGCRFSVPYYAAGTCVPCPGCGGRILVPAARRSSGASDACAMWALVLGIISVLMAIIFVVAIFFGLPLIFLAVFCVPVAFAGVALGLVGLRSKKQIHVAIGLFLNVSALIGMGCVALVGYAFYQLLKNMH